MAKVAAHESWAKTADRSARTKNAREALNAKFLKMVDPEGRLPLEIRKKMAESAKSAHYRRMAIASARARRGKLDFDELFKEMPNTVES